MKLGNDFKNLKFQFSVQNPSYPASTDVSLSLTYKDGPLLLAYNSLTGTFSVATYTDSSNFKALVAWGEEYSGLLGFYEPPSSCHDAGGPANDHKCGITNSVRMQMKMPYFSVNAPKKTILKITVGTGFIFHSTVRNTMGATCLVQQENWVYCDKINYLTAGTTYEISFMFALDENSDEATLLNSAVEFTWEIYDTADNKVITFKKSYNTVVPVTEKALDLTN